MTILGQLYQPTEKDRRSGLNQRRWFERIIFQTISSIVVSVAGDPVPVDTLRMVKGIAILATPGAAQFTRYIAAFINRNGTNIQITFATPEAAVAAQPYGFTWTSLDFPMMVGEVLNYRSNNNAGVAANTLDAFAWGYEIPRGNYEAN